MAKKKAKGPDFARGVPLTKLTDGAMLQGHFKGEPILVARREDAYFAIGATCTHYGGPLADGIMAGDTIRCPWHHACFSLRTGEAVRAPALDPIGCWRVERNGDMVFVREKLPEPGPKSASSDDLRVWPESVVIVGGGAAGLAAADVLRREGYER